MADQHAIFDAEIAGAAPKRTFWTNIQGLDQVIAISEDSINSILSARYNSQLKRKTDRRLREFHHALPKYGAISATLSAPRIQMAVPESPESVYFFLNFEKGSFQYWTGFGPTAEQETQDISGWSVAFETSFGLSRLATVPRAIASQITLKPGSYSASQLILGFSAAAAAKLVWTTSVCPGLEDNEDLRFAIQNIFKTYMDTYLQWLSTGAYSVLGYIVKVEDPSANAQLAIPSFPPTAVKCLIQNYVPATVEFKSQYPARAGLDMFVIEEMVDQPFPDIPYNPAKAGNWIIGGLDANLTISRRIFWECYVLQKFALLNMQCLTLANDSSYWSQGRKGSKETGNDWIITDGPRPVSAPWILNATKATFKWQGRLKREAEGARCILDTAISNDLAWIPGSDTATISVSIMQNWSVHSDNLRSLKIGADSCVSWTAAMTLNTIKAGELSVTVACGAPDLQYLTNMSLFDGQQCCIPLREHHENQVNEALKSGVDMGKIQTELTDALNGQSKFVFPGGGDFFMKNPKFNTTGDLLIDLSYVQKEIAVDDDFHLQVSAPGVAGTDGQWLKVSDTADNNSTVVLVATQQEATLFQIDNGNLVIDQAGLPKGLRASTKSAAAPAKVQDLVFVSGDTFDKIDASGKLECSTTGSKFSYSLDSTTAHWSANWYGTFALDVETKSRVLLFKGKVKDAAPLAVFSLNAIY